MAGDTSIVSADQAAYFLNIAVIGATLLGLSFVTLAFFLDHLLKRYENAVLPIFRAVDPSDAVRKSFLTPPESVTDFQLLDGDPLVVFIAFSVAVTWNLFLLPLVIGLTVAWEGIALEVLAIELLAWFGIFCFCFEVRNRKIGLLKPYLTREELAWPLLSRITLVLFSVAAIVIVFAAVSRRMPDTLRWQLPFFASGTSAALFSLKFICILSLVIGTYTTNKDMFIFFKSVALERMRSRWLQSFLQDKYPELQAKIEQLSKNHASSIAVDDILQIWQEGPMLILTNDQLNKNDAKVVWENLVRRPGRSAFWMLDVPAIAGWAAHLEHSLRRLEEDSGSATA